MLYIVAYIAGLVTASLVPAVARWVKATWNKGKSVVEDHVE